VLLVRKRDSNPELSDQEPPKLSTAAVRPTTCCLFGE
jgi:hypothetical protein